MIEIPKPEIDSIYLKTVEEPEFFISWTRLERTGGINQHK